jgi:hypothetical protein
VAQGVEHILSKHKALSSNPSTGGKKGMQGRERKMKATVLASETFYV